MQIGQTIWAIDPCEMTFTKKEALKVGKAYEVKKIDNECFVIESELHPMHVFYLREFKELFSLTPPEGKGGVKESIIAQIEKSISELTQLRDHLTEVLNKE